MMITKSKEDKNMIRKPIRNTTSPKQTKPRVFDALINTDDGEVFLEVKNAKQTEVIRLVDVLSQIEEAKRSAEAGIKS